MKLYITMRPAGFVGDDFAQDIEIETYSDNSNVIECTLREYEKKRGIDVLNALMFEYNNRADSIKFDARKYRYQIEKPRTVYGYAQ